MKTVPKQVDHEERRSEIIEALWRLASNEGLSSVSFRRVAAEAGVSVRRIQYYFGTKDSLLADALQLLGERVFARGLSAIEKLGPEPSAERILRALMESGIPSDEDRRTESLLFFSFYVAAITDPEYRNDAARATLDWTYPFAQDLIAKAVEAGETHPDVDPERESLILMSAFYGLSLSVLSGTQTADAALSALDNQLSSIFR